jgi:hypothetical protein
MKDWKKFECGKCGREECRNESVDGIRCANEGNTNNKWYCQPYYTIYTIVLSVVCGAAYWCRKWFLCVSMCVCVFATAQTTKNPLDHLIPIICVAESRKWWWANRIITTITRLPLGTMHVLYIERLAMRFFHLYLVGSLFIIVFIPVPFHCHAFL